MPGKADGFLTVRGTYRVTQDWSLDLPGDFLRRFERGDLVIWRPGLTFWVAVWGDDFGEPVADRVRWMRNDANRSAYDWTEYRRGELVELTYRLEEPSDDARVPALYAFVVSPRNYVQIVAYFDQEADVSIARAVIGSLRAVSPA